MYISLPVNELICCSCVGNITSGPAVLHKSLLRQPCCDVLAGIPPSEFNAKLIQGKRSAVAPHLANMSNYMGQFARSAMLMDIRIDAPNSMPIILQIHKTWTTADKEAVLQ